MSGNKYNMGSNNNIYNNNDKVDDDLKRLKSTPKRELDLQC